jgi:putative ABC transport system permease protein
LKLKPPSLAEKFLRIFLRDDLVEDVLGDLDEKFYKTAKSKTVFRAKLNYWYQVIHYLRPFAIRKSKGIHLTHSGMFENYTKIAWRTLMRQKMYSSIKIGGFAIGITACILIALFIQHELSYDRHYKNGDRIFRIMRVSAIDGGRHLGIYFPAPFAKTMEENYPEIERAGHYIDNQSFGAGNNEVRRVDQIESTHEEGFAFMDQGLLEIFEIPIIQGHPKKALTEPNTIVISERMSKKYFPGENPMEKILILNNDEKRQYKISGVMRDFPATMHIQCDFILSKAEHELWPGERDDWGAGNYLDYILVREGTDVKELESKLLSIVKNHFVPGVIERGSDADAVAWAKSLSFQLQPVKDIYLNEVGIGDGLRHGDIRYIWLFGAIAVFILIIAAVNFINLSTAKSANRAREVGLRKVAGSRQGSLIMQFLTESLVFSFFSFALALFLTILLLPYFNVLLSKTLTLPWSTWWMIPALIGGGLIVGIIAGIYPAFYLSSFKPALVLKGNVSRGSKNSVTRSVLVIFQFTISIILIVGTLVVNRQMNYILTKKVGFNKDQVVLLEGTHTLGETVVPFKAELLNVAGVEHASISAFLPIEGTTRNGSDMWVVGKSETESIESQQWRVDHDYAETMGLNILQGRDFSAAINSDSQAVVINTAAMKGLQLEKPVGQFITNGRTTWQIIGVMEDFHFKSFRQNIEPLCIVIGKSRKTVSVKVNTADMQGTLKEIEKVWKRFSPHQAMRFGFLDQSFARMYEDVGRMGNIFSIFAILAIIVACLGLFALSAFMVEQREKEISIRLVLGASVQSIFNLLTLNFVKLVVISVVIAIPISLYFAQEWLEDFAYRIDIGWQVFFVAAIAALAIAIATISYQSLRAALISPAENLKSE